MFVAELLSPDSWEGQYVMVNRRDFLALDSALTSSWMMRSVQAPDGGAEIASTFDDPQQPARYTVLLYHNSLNALFLDDLIGMFVGRVRGIVDAEYAYRDPIYDRQPKCLPLGESLVWALAKERGRFESRLWYPGGTMCMRARGWML
jgi:hypothetical protein